MINKTKSATLLAIAFVALTVSAVTVQADNGYGQYEGPQPSQNILVDKLVGRPTTTKGGTVDANYVDNYTSSDTRFGPGDVVFFKVRVKNTSNTKLTNVEARDYVPAELEPIEGPGNFDANSHTVSFKVGDLNPNEEKVYYLKMKIVDQNKLPADKSVICPVNKAQAFTDKISNEDTAQFCVEKQVQGAKKVPEAGPELGIALFAGEVLALGAGMFLKKKSA